jgi:biopolymer transport protein ExbB/TolQ
MGILTNIFFLLSTSLLIPVMLTLLYALVRCIVLCGQVLAASAARRRTAAGLDNFTRALERGDTRLPPLPERGFVVDALNRLTSVAGNDVLSDKILDDCRLHWQNELERLRGLARLGPACGLMGTLIPLGPALVGLAAGDLQTMSQNLVIAFATTVVGLLIGILAGVLVGVVKRWYQADAVLIAFAAGRLAQLQLAASHSPAGEPTPTDRPIRRDMAETGAKDSPAASAALEVSHA